eukprot:6186410-Pleurochrysis_carterae.AAC.2
MPARPRRRPRLHLRPRRVAPRPRRRCALQEARPPAPPELARPRRRCACCRVSRWRRRGRGRRRGRSQPGSTTPPTASSRPSSRRQRRLCAGVRPRPPLARVLPVRREEAARPVGAPAQLWGARGAWRRRGATGRRRGGSGRRLWPCSRDPAVALPAREQVQPLTRARGLRVQAVVVVGQGPAVPRPGVRHTGDELGVRARRSRQRGLQPDGYGARKAPRRATVPAVSSVRIVQDAIVAQHHVPARRGRVSGDEGLRAPDVQVAASVFLVDPEHLRVNRLRGRDERELRHDGPRLLDDGDVC